VAIVLCVGHAVQDFVFGVDALPTRGEKYRANAFDTVGGGPAATAAVAVAKLGGRARLAARIGDDAVADVVIAELQRYGYTVRKKHATGETYISLPGKSGVVVNDRKRDAPKVLMKLLRRAREGR
jgi:sugar/nucleoside kinase (ribokinase family)